VICNTLGRMCAQRKAWQQSGEMYFRDHITHGGSQSGWVFPANRWNPNQNPGFFWTECPGFGGTLPDLYALCNRLVREEAAWRKLQQAIWHQARFPDWLRKSGWQADGDDGEGEE
jgi:hypothetical protein